MQGDHFIQLECRVLHHINSHVAYTIDDNDHLQDLIDDSDDDEDSEDEDDSDAKDWTRSNGPDDSV